MPRYEMSSSAALSLVRGAGRGTNLRSSGVNVSTPPPQLPRPPFLGQGSRNIIPTISKREDNPSQVPPGGRGASLSKARNVPPPKDNIEGEMSEYSTRRRDVGPPSSFSASILNNRRSRPSYYENNNNDHFSGARRFGRNNSPHSDFADRYTSRSAGDMEEQRVAARDKWFSAAKKKEVLEQIDLSMMPVVSTKTEEGNPFAWGDLSASLNELPEGHWARSFVRGAIAQIDSNSALGAVEKKAMLTQVLQTLGRLSQQAAGDDDGIVDVAQEKGKKRNEAAAG